MIIILTVCIYIYIYITHTSQITDFAPTTSCRAFSAAIGSSRPHAGVSRPGYVWFGLCCLLLVYCLRLLCVLFSVYCMNVVVVYFCYMFDVLFISCSKYLFVWQAWLHIFCEQGLSSMHARLCTGTGER